MNKRHLFNLLILFGPLVKAQPGGGGGLTIHKLLDKNLQEINLKSTDLQFRNFVLNNNQVAEELYNFNPLILIPASWNYYIDNYQQYPNQRLLIEYKSEIMIVDFLNILQENGMGMRDEMDSLVFLPKHFSVLTNQNSNGNDEQWQRNRAIAVNGVTPFTTDKLLQCSWIKFNNETDTSFLKEENLSPHFILKRGVHFFKNKEYDEAIADINLATKKGLNQNETEESLATLSSCYLNIGETENAIELISQIISSHKVGDNNRLMQYYKSRIELYTEQKNYQKALLDFDFIINNTLENKLIYIAEKADFKRKYLYDCESSLIDLRKIISSIPSNHLSQHPGGWSEYAETFFALGSLECACDEPDSAFKNWLKAMEFGYAQTSADYAVMFFDSIIQKYSHTPELYLCRAIANYKRAPYLGWGDETKNVLNKSLVDIKLAEENGMHDFRINLYRAQSLNLLKLNDDALTQINIAIQKNKDDPRAYAVRYKILSDLGKTVWGQDHPDLVKYRALCNQWNFSEK